MHTITYRALSSGFPTFDDVAVVAENVQMENGNYGKPLIKQSYEGRRSRRDPK